MSKDEAWVVYYPGTEGGGPQHTSVIAVFRTERQMQAFLQRATHEELGCRPSIATAHLTTSAFGAMRKQLMEEARITG